MPSTDGESMKFSFVNPPLNPEVSAREKKKMTAASPPMGILYVATYLKNEGVEVSLLDAIAKHLTIEVSKTPSRLPKPLTKPTPKSSRLPNDTNICRNRVPYLEFSFT